MEWMTLQFEQYGFMFLFGGLFAESLALPFPGELAMAIAGHLAYQSNASLWMILLYSFLGASIGTMLTYLLGRLLGAPFFLKYGKYVFMNPQRIDKLSIWFGKYGNKLLLVSYFVPGLRHFTGYVSGILKIRVDTFLIYSNLSAVVWVILYVSAGYVFSNQLEQVLHLISANAWKAAAIGALAITIFIAIRKLRLSSKKAMLASSKSRSTE